MKMSNKKKDNNRSNTMESIVQQNGDRDEGARVRSAMKPHLVEDLSQLLSLGPLQVARALQHKTETWLYSSRTCG